MSDLWKRLAQDSREKVEEWNRIYALLHGAQVRNLLRLRCVGSREVRRAYGLVLHLRICGTEVVIGFARMPFASKVEVFSKPWGLQELSRSLRVMVTGEVLREIIGEGNVFVEDVDFVVDEELRMRVPLEICWDGKVMEVDIWIRSIEDVEIVADVFGVVGSGMEFPPALYLRLPLRVGSASLSIGDVEQLGAGDIILLDGFIPRLEAGPRS